MHRSEHAEDARASEIRCGRLGGAFANPFIPTLAELSETPTQTPPNAASLTGNITFTGGPILPITPTPNPYGTSTRVTSATPSASVINNLCPHLDGDIMIDANGDAYTIHCDYMIASLGQDVASTSGTSASDCIQQCSSYPDCVGVVTDVYGKCTLSTGDYVGRFQDPGNIALVRSTPEKRSSDPEPLDDGECGDRDDGAPCVSTRSEVWISERQAANGCIDPAGQDCHDSMWTCTWEYAHRHILSS